jgi:uncharacterized membrane protein YbhN (UPF0104 family)
MTRTSIRQIARLAGLIASALAVAWIIFRFVKSGALDLLAHSRSAPTALAIAILICACGYALAMCLPAFVWWRLISALSPGRASARATMTTYAISQYGKYLPGNVAHYVLRHAWSRRSGVPHAALGLAVMLEATLLLVAALTVTLLGDTERLRLFSMLDARLAIVLLGAMLLGLGVGLALARRRTFADRWHIPALPSLFVLLACLACYALFFVASAALLDALAHVLGLAIDSFAMLLAAAAASWAAGFVVLGAPGGLGVREAAFVALAAGALGESQALLLIGLFRIVTFLGDSLLFAAGGALALRGADANDASSTQDSRSAP